jgi:hypothetical protein
VVLGCGLDTPGSPHDPANSDNVSIAAVIGGICRKNRGVKRGLPDVLIPYRGRLIFIELKSRSGIASRVQKEIRLELLPADA